jgi:uncharacterized protein YjdB
LKKILIILFFAISSSVLFGQTVLKIEGRVENNSESGIWEGINVPRSQPTSFTYQNNSITSVNASGYMLQAGDENPSGSNNNLDGEIISGNKFTWNGTDPTSTTHGVFTGYNINAILKYNYLNNVPMGLIRKSNGMTNTSGGVAYNIVNNSQAVAAVAKGINGIGFYNNTFYSDQVLYTSPGSGTWRGLIDIYSNTDGDLNSPSTGTKIKNNIFYTRNQIYNINIYDAACLPGFESDYNLFYCETGTPIFSYLGTKKTFAQWQALGYDTHSVVVNPNFKDFTDFVPDIRLDYGTDLGITWEKGLSVDAAWGSTDPETVNQNGNWQVGARIYSSQRMPVTDITVRGSVGATTITTDNGTLQLSAAVLPSNATDKTVTWSLSNGTGQATISSAGLVTAVDNGTVTAMATANDGSGVTGTLNITLSNQIVPVTAINLSGASIITIDKGSLQLSAAVSPVNATNKNVTWSVLNGSGQATINSTGIITAVDNGTVTAKATAIDGSGVYGTLIITISNQIIKATGITVSGAGGATSITTDNGFLQLTETVLPVNATDKTVTWSIVSNTGQATINSSGLVTAVDNGTVTARATANDGSGVYGTLLITISNQVVQVTGITVSGAGGLTSITTDDGTIQLSAEVLPVNATNKTVTWSISSGTGLAAINATGLVKSADNGIITVRATSNDGSGVYGTLVITISNQLVPVTGVIVTGAGGANTIITNNGSLQMSTEVLPLNATDNTVTWSISSGAGLATINTTGLIIAADNGTITVRATANDGTGIYGSRVITISNQIISVAGINVTGAGGSTTISKDNGTLQLSAEVLPVNSTNKTVTWSLVNSTGKATISTTGLVTAVDNGTITARATSNDGSGVYSTMVITISNQIVLVTSISITGVGGAKIITTENGTLQLNASVLPANATDKTVIWTLVNGTGQAIISSTGLVTTVSNGTVTARATANDGSAVFSTMVITINISLIPVTDITVTGEGVIAAITTDNGSLQLSEAVLPANATDKTVTWSLINGTGRATINPTGLVMAVDNGNVSAIATANDGSGIFGTLDLTISNQIVHVTDIYVSGTGGATAITVDDGSLQMIAAVLPANATDNTIIWSVVNGTGQAIINSSGMVTAVDNGTVIVTATANDGSAVFGSLVINIFNQIVPVTGISVSGAGGATSITTDDGSLPLSATVLPLNATDKNVIWTVVNGTGQATINAMGLLNAVDNGTVTARATANDGSGIYGTLIINISNQVVPVTGITIAGAGGATMITTDNGSLQLSAAVLPANSTDKTVTWSLVNGTDLAAISSTGLVSAVDNGTITVRATANDGSGVYGTLVITISNQFIPVIGITVAGSGGRSSITTDNGTLQLIAMVLPANATNKTVSWSLVNGNVQAIINADGRVTAIDNGIVTVSATAADGSGVYGTLEITISNQVIPVTTITVSGAGGKNTITNDNGSLQLITAVLPANATNKTMRWSLVNGTGQASINSTGLVTAIDNGMVTARATAVDGSGIYGILEIAVSNQIVPVTGITVMGSGGATIIASDNGSLQLSAAIFPSYATNKTVTWSLVNGSGKATINSAGHVTAVDNGTVTAMATANDGSGVFATLVITIYNQVIPVTAISVTGSGGSSTISNDNGTLQLSASVVPSNATDNSVTWSLVNGTGLATINTTGLVTAINNGTITARATANDGSGVYGNLVIPISNQSGPVTSITVTGAGGATTITTDNGSLQLNAVLSPANATVKTVTWSFVNGAGLATINSSGLVSAVDNGTITVRATANDGSGVFGTMVIIISNQVIAVTGIILTGENGATTIRAYNGSLQVSEAVFPANATDKTVTWSLVNNTGQAIINSTGLVTAVKSGTVTARATSNDGSGVYGTLDITISGPEVPVSSITVVGVNGVNTITNNNMKLQLNAAVFPVNATDKTITWSLDKGIGKATINSTGLVTAIDNGSVEVKATANDGSGAYGLIDIPIIIENFELSSIIVTRDEIKIQLNNNYFSWKAGLYNWQGGLVQTRLVNSDIIVFDISSLSSGLYLVVLSKGENLRVAKVIKP